MIYCYYSYINVSERFVFTCLCVLVCAGVRTIFVTTSLLCVRTFWILYILHNIAALLLYTAVLIQSIDYSREEVEDWIALANAL
jgi:low affinity Fe/Cu permease